MGTYQPATGQPYCIAASSGSYVNITGSLSQRSCQVGTYQSQQQSTTCLLCATGFYQIAIGQF
jgi:hypothetical protein